MLGGEHCIINFDCYKAFNAKELSCQIEWILDESFRIAPHKAARNDVSDDLLVVLARDLGVMMQLATPQMGVTRACGLMDISRSLFRYEAKRPADQELKERLCELAVQKRRYGYRRLQVPFRHEGWEINRKRTYRVYHDDGPQTEAQTHLRVRASDQGTALGAKWELVDGFCLGQFG